MLEWASIAAEFGLGQPLSVAPLARGHPDVVLLTTDHGPFVVKPARSADQAELYDQAAGVLSAAGIRQARPFRTAAGSLVSESGVTVQEFLPGRICLSPSTDQALATMRHLGVYHAVLETVPVTAALHSASTVWDRVTSGEFLVQALPGLLRKYGPPGSAGEYRLTAAMAQVERSLPQMRQLPHQLVHGDIGPDNVLMDGDEVVAIIDFTPFFQPVLFAVATAVYRYHVHSRHPGPGSVQASFAATAARRPWTSAERELRPAMLVREALRRLAAPLAVAAQSRAQPPVRTDERYQAVLEIMNIWPQLYGPDPPGK